MKTRGGTPIHHVQQWYRWNKGGQEAETVQETYLQKSECRKPWSVYCGKRARPQAQSDQRWWNLISDGLGLLSYLLRPESSVMLLIRSKNRWKEWNFRNFVQVQNKSAHRIPKQKTINENVHINTYMKANFPYIYICKYIYVCVCVLRRIKLNPNLKKCSSSKILHVHIFKMTS